MDGFLARRKTDPRYASERRVDPFPSSGIYKSSHYFAEDKKKRIYKKGEDADGDGITNEAEKNKPSKADFKKDDNNNGKPDFMEKKGGSGGSDDESDKKKEKKKGSSD